MGKIVALIAATLLLCAAACVNLGEVIGVAINDRKIRSLFRMPDITGQPQPNLLLGLRANSPGRAQGQDRIPPQSRAIPSLPSSAEGPLCRTRWEDQERTMRSLRAIQGRMPSSGLFSPSRCSLALPEASHRTPQNRYHFARLALPLALLCGLTSCSIVSSNQVHIQREASMPAYSTDKGFTGSDKGKKTGGNQTGGTQGGGQTAQAASKPSTAGGMTLQQRIDKTFQQRGDEYDRGERGTPAATGLQYDVTGRPVTDGTVPNIPNASPGQIVGALTSALPGGILNTAGDFTDGVDLNRAPRGGFAGQAIDSMLGTTPGAIEGQIGNPIASSTNSRGDVLQQQPTLAGTRAIVGDPEDAATGGDAATSGPGGDYSNVALQDVPLAMRKKNPLAGTSLLTSGMV